MMENATVCHTSPSQTAPALSVYSGFEQTIHSAKFLDFPQGRTHGEAGPANHGRTCAWNLALEAGCDRARCIVSAQVCVMCVQKGSADREQDRF